MRLSTCRIFFYTKKQVDNKTKEIKMATKAFKQEKVEAIKEQFAKATVAVVTEYRGLSVEEITKLRRQLQKENSDYTVVKNTLAKIAIKDTQFESLAEKLTGPIAIAFGFGDQVAPAKVVSKFTKDNKKEDMIMGAVLDGKLLSAAEAKSLAELPSKEELYAKMLGCINSPASGIANSVNTVMRQLVYTMDAVRKQKECA